MLFPLGKQKVLAIPKICKETAGGAITKLVADAIGNLRGIRITAKTAKSALFSTTVVVDLASGTTLAAGTAFSCAKAGRVIAAKVKAKT